MICLRGLLVAVGLLVSGATINNDVALAQAQPQLPRAESETGGSTSSIDFWRELDLAAAKLTAGDAVAALDDLRRLVHHKEFPNNDTDFRYRAYFMLGYLEILVGTPEEAVAQLSAAGAAATGALDASYWQLMMEATWRAKQVPETVAAASTIARDFPEVVRTWDPRFLFAILERSRWVPEADADRTALLDTLWQTGYTPDSNYGSMEVFWLSLLQAYADAGNLKRAKAVAETLKDPESVLELSFDRNLKAYAPADPAQAMKDAIERRVQKLRLLAEAKPREAQPIVQIATWLSIGGDLPEALQVLDDAIANGSDETDNNIAFDDQDEYLGQLHEARGAILRTLGRWDEAIDSQKRALEIARRTDPNEIDQVIRLAEYYFLMGKPGQAMETIAMADTDAANDLGRISIGQVKVCAAQQLGDAGAVKEALEPMLESPEANFGAVRVALLCTDDQDKLAELILQGLSDREERRDVLRSLQRSWSSGHESEFEKLLEDRLEQVRQRSDVVAAVAKYGRILDWPMYF